MATTPHPDDPAEGSRETVERELKREKGGEQRRTQEQVQADIDAGKQGDKTPGFDPAAVPMEADAEAGGSSTPPSSQADPIEKPTRENAASTANAMRPQGRKRSG